MHKEHWGPINKDLQWMPLTCRQVSGIPWGSDTLRARRRPSGPLDTQRSGLPMDPCLSREVAGQAVSNLVASRHRPNQSNKPTNQWPSISFIVGCKVIVSKFPSPNLRKCLENSSWLFFTPKYTIWCRSKAKWSPFSFSTVSLYCCSYATISNLECPLQSHNNRVIKIPSLLRLAGYQLYARVHLQRKECLLLRTHKASSEVHIHISSVAIPVTYWAIRPLSGLELLFFFYYVFENKPFKTSSAWRIMIKLKFV